MPKTCNYEQCSFSQFGGGFCKFHQWCRKDKKQKEVKRKPIKKVSAKKAKQNREDAKITKRDHEVYREIWEEREHIDFETGKFIPGAEPLTLYFHHVLPKRDEKDGGYPQFRHCKWNIILVTWETHTKAETNIDLVPKIKAYRDELLKIYVA
jgi:hypothetical protein